LTVYLLEKYVDLTSGTSIKKHSTEVDLLIGDYSKAKEKLGWEPKVKCDELVKIMIDGYINC